MLPILERFAADTHLRSERFLGEGVPNPVQSKMLSKWLSVVCFKFSKLDVMVATRLNEAAQS